MTATVLRKEAGVVRSLRIPLSLWEALGREAEAQGVTRNVYVVRALREACEADRAERLRREVLELERARLREAGLGIYGS